MKNLGFLAPVAMLAATILPMQAQNKPLEIKGINVEMMKTPDYGSAGTTAKRSTPQDWLAIEVEFNADLPKDQPVLEEMSLKVHVIFKSMMDSRKYFTGEVTYINVLAGKGKFGVMYIPPGSLRLVDNGRIPSVNDIFEIGVELSVRGQQIAFANKNSSSAGPWWTQAQPLTGHVLNKNQTPFAPLYWDRYEQIKIETR